MMTRSRLFLVALLLAFPATAQDKPAPAAHPDDVVVVGNPERDQQIRAFVQGMTRATTRDPLTRFQDTKLCPLVIGWNADNDKAVTERMRRVAAAAKVAVAPADCRHANVLVLFANDKKAMIRLLRQRYPDFLRDAHGSPMAVPDEDGPAAVWHLDGVVNQDGVTLRALADGGPYVQRGTIAASRIKASARPVYLMSFVVIERHALNGISPIQVADYATMRALTDASPARARETGAPTILTVLETSMGSEMPVTLTEWDMSFLRGLYAVPPNLFASAQRGAIGEQMKREIGKSGSAAP